MADVGGARISRARPAVAKAEAAMAVLRLTTSFGSSEVGGADGWWMGRIIINRDKFCGDVIGRCVTTRAPRLAIRVNMGCRRREVAPSSKFVKRLFAH